MGLYGPPYSCSTHGIGRLTTSSFAVLRAVITRTASESTSEQSTAMIWQGLCKQLVQNGLSKLCLITLGLVVGHITIYLCVCMRIYIYVVVVVLGCVGCVGFIDYHSLILDYRLLMYIMLLCSKNIPIISSLFAQRSLAFNGSPGLESRDVPLGT